MLSTVFAGRLVRGGGVLKPIRDHARLPPTLALKKLLNETNTPVEDGLEEGVNGEEDSGIMIVARDGHTEEGVHESLINNTPIEDITMTSLPGLKLPR